jgi:hypothetical protein
MYQPERTLNSADEVSVMQMPNQQVMQQKNMMLPPGKRFGAVRSMSDPRDMIKISPLKYIVFNNPQGTHDYLYSKGVDVRNNVLSVYESAKRYAAQGGESTIIDMVKNIDTPYKQMVLKAYAKETGFEGEQKPTETKAPEKTEKTEEKGVFKLSTQTIIIALVIVIFFLIVLRK